MVTNTARLGLIKPAGSEDVNIGQLNQNSDTLDLQPGIFICTSGTRPASSFAGQQIYETDTGAIRIRVGSAWKILNLIGKATYRLLQRSNTSQSLAAGTNVRIAWSTQTDDPGDANSYFSWDGTARDLTVEMPGMYRVNVILNYSRDVAGSGTDAFKFEVNGTYVRVAVQRHITNTTDHPLNYSGTALLKCSAGDKIAFTVAAATASAVYVAGSATNVFEVQWVGNS